MANSKAYFAQNISLLHKQDLKEGKVQETLNRGLYELAMELEELRDALRQLRQDVQSVEQRVARLG